MALFLFWRLRLLYIKCLFAAKKTFTKKSFQTFYSFDIFLQQVSNKEEVLVNSCERMVKLWLSSFQSLKVNLLECSINRSQLECLVKQSFLSLVKLHPINPWPTFISHFFSLFFLLFLSFSYSLTLPLFCSFSLFLPCSFSLSFVLSFVYSLTLSLFLFLSLSLFLAFSLSLTLYLCLSFTLSHFLTLSFSLFPSSSLSLTLSLPFCLSLSLFSS